MESPWRSLYDVPNSAHNNNIGKDPERAFGFFGRLLRVLILLGHHYAAPPFYILLVGPGLAFLSYDSTDLWRAVCGLLAIVAFCVGFLKSHHWSTLAVIAGGYLVLLLLYFAFEVREFSYLGAVWFCFGVAAAGVDNYFRVAAEAARREFVS